MSPRSLLLRRAEVSDVECKGRKGESSLGRRMQGVADAQLAPQVTRAEKEELFKIRTRHSNGQERCFCCNAEEIRGESLPYIHPSFPALFTRAMPGELFARSFHTSHTREEREREREREKRERMAFNSKALGRNILWRGRAASLSLHIHKQYYS